MAGYATGCLHASLRRSRTLGIRHSWSARFEPLSRTVPLIDGSSELWVPVIRDTLASPANQNIFYRSHLFVYCYSKCALVSSHYSVDVTLVLAFLIDSTVLVLTIWGLYHRELRPADKLWHMLYRQGIVYFVATLLVNVPLVVSSRHLGSMTC